MGFEKLMCTSHFENENFISKIVYSILFIKDEYCGI